MYVNDEVTAHTHRHFLAAATVAILMAYIVFGHPRDDPTHPPCINPNKWTENISWELHFLGYNINARKMEVSWPRSKREKLHLFLNKLLAPQRLGKCPMIGLCGGKLCVTMIKNEF